MKKRKSKDEVAAAPAAVDNPYIAARREWNEIYGGFIASAANWRKVAFAAIGVCGIAVVGLVTFKAGEHIVPWVVQVDKLGRQIVSGPAQPMAEVDPVVMASQLARWTMCIRTVYAEAAAERALIDEGYAMMLANTPGVQKLNDYMSAHNPFKRAQEETVEVQVDSALPISEKVWRVEWREKRFGRDGSLIDETSWQVDLTTSHIPPKDRDRLQINPQGIYVTEYSWLQVGKGLR